MDTPIAVRTIVVGQQQVFFICGNGIEILMIYSG